MKRKALYLVLSLALISGSVALAGGEKGKKEKCCEAKGIKALFHSKKKCKEKKGEAEVKGGCKTEKSAKKGCCAHKKAK